LLKDVKQGPVQSKKRPRHHGDNKAQEKSGANEAPSDTTKDAQTASQAPTQ